MALSLSPRGNATVMSMLSVVIFELVYLVNGEGFLTSNTTVLDTVSLQCYTVSYRSYLELVAVCLSQDLCLGMKGQSESGLICSCPSGPTWHTTIGTDLFSSTHMRTRKNITLRGKNFWDKFWLRHDFYLKYLASQIAKFMGPTWGPSGSYRPQMDPVLAPWTLLYRHITWEAYLFQGYIFFFNSKPTGSSFTNTD